MSLTEYLSQKLVKLMMLIIERLIGNPIIMFGEIAFKKGTCCICGRKIHEPNVKTGHFSLIQIYKKATWQEPQATVNMPNGESYNNFAVAIVCAGCEVSVPTQEIQSRVKFAIELDMRKKDLVYHDVKKLEDYPLIIEG